MTVAPFDLDPGMGPAAVAGVLFVAGLVGGVTHCVAMCGPFVLAQVSAGLARVPAAGMSELTRLRGAALVPYHLGRMTTYVGLGALAGALAETLVAATGFRWLAGALLALAAAAFLLQGLWRGAGLVARLASRRGRPGGGAGRLGEALARLAGPLMEPGPGGLRRYALGVVLGFLPCGLIYAGLAAAAGLADPLAGGAAMAALAAGTVPGLVGVGLGGHLVLRRGGETVRIVAAALMAANAVILGYLAWRTVS